jgi:hypothetical protein
MIGMLVIGFFVVLVVDVTSSLVGRVKFGETSMQDLWGKVVDRVLDRDVPRVQDAKPKNIERSAPPPRAPLPAARPEDDARHVERAPDPQVEDARQRLDDLLQRL